MRLNKHKWLIEVSLIVIIIVMGFFVVLELRRTFQLMRQQTNPISTPASGMILQNDDSNPVPEMLVDEATPTKENTGGLINLDGDAVLLEDFEGTPLLVNFWATWCPPCLEEMPLIQEYADRYDGDLVVLAINAGEDEAIVRDFITRHQLRMTFLLDPTNLTSREFRVYGFPTSLFYDAAGNLMSTHIGELNAGLLDRNLQKIGIGE